MDEDLPPVPPRLIAVAYLLAAACVVAPLGVVLAAFVAVVLVRRGHAAHGAGVIVLAVAATAAGATLLR